MKIELLLEKIGHWPAPVEVPEMDPRLLAFFAGKPVALDEALAAHVQGEFEAQERYRQTVVQKLSALVRALQAEAAEIVNTDGPVLDPGEAFDAGYKMGAYNATAAHAQMVQDVINEAAHAAQR